MKIRWTPTALGDLESLHTYIAADSHEAAARTVEKICAGIEALALHPQMGRAGRVAGTPELVLRPYVVAYRARETAIEILAIMHGARRWPARS